MAAAFSRHLAAAARHLAGAARAAARRERDHGDHNDPELGLSSSTTSSSSDTSSSDDGNGGAGGDGNGGGSSGDGNGGGDGDTGGDVGDEVEAMLEHSYELFGVLLGIAVPVPVYFGLPPETKDGAAWIWCLLTYAVAFTMTVTFISMRVFRSRCCLCTVLLALLLVVCMVAAGGAVFSIIHLMIAYLGVWGVIDRPSLMPQIK